MAIMELVILGAVVMLLQPEGAVASLLHQGGQPLAVTARGDEKETRGDEKETRGDEKETRDDKKETTHDAFNLRDSPQTGGTENLKETVSVQLNVSSRGLVTIPACSRSLPTIRLPTATDYAVVTSPNYPNNYNAISKCGWKLATTPPNRLRVVCASVSMAFLDYMLVWDVSANSLWWIGGNRINYSLTLAGSTGAIGIFTTFWWTGRGFKCTVSSVAQTKCLCGVKKTTRIIGGQETGQNEYPWMVALQYGKSSKPICGGVLISSSWVLTAAHCVNTLIPIGVALGQHQSDTYDPPVLYTTSLAIKTHTAHNAVISENDIALIQIKPVDFNSNKNIRPVCLPTSMANSYAGTTATATGWGQTSYGGSTSTKLLEVNIPVITNKLCTTQLSKFKITPNMLCAGELAGGKDSCKGDSGGPLIVASGANYELVGIASFGDKCGLPNKPGVYTRVTKYLEWIKQNTGTAGYCGRS